MINKTQKSAVINVTLLGKQSKTHKKERQKRIVLAVCDDVFHRFSKRLRFLIYVGRISVVSSKGDIS